jgi:hypothetical protein
MTSALIGGEWWTSRPGRFTPGERVLGTHCIRGCMDLRAGLGYIEKWKFLPPPGLELRFLGRPARSQSLYRLHYPGSPLIAFSMKISRLSKCYQGTFLSQYWIPQTRIAVPCCNIAYNFNCVLRWLQSLRFWLVLARCSVWVSAATRTSLTEGFAFRDRNSI